MFNELMGLSADKKSHFLLRFILQTLFFLLLFLITVFSQDIIHRGVIPDRLTSERLWEIHKPNVNDLQGLNDIESLRLNSQSIHWQTDLGNPQKEFYAEEGFNTKETWTTINKTLLYNGLLIELIVQAWNGLDWVNSSKSSYTYEGNNKTTEVLGQDWDGSAWVNDYKVSLTYDGNNNIAVILYQTWHEVIGYVNDWKSSYIYDINNNQTERLVQNWNGSAWVNQRKESFTYDVNNNQTEGLYQNWNGSVWVNQRKESFTYDVNNNQTEGLYQNWNGSVWVNQRKESFTYDVNNNRTEWLYQNWNGSAWVNDYEWSYTYDGNNNLTEWLVQDWDGSAWVNDYKWSYTYDGNNNLTEELNQTWYEGIGWWNIMKRLYTYVPATVINDDLSFVNSCSLSNNYPNPFNPTTTIGFGILEKANVRLSVLNVLGEEIKVLLNEEKDAGYHSVDFNANDLPSGVYFYQLIAGNFIDAKKMLLLK